jgi:integrase
VLDLATAEPEKSAQREGTVTAPDQATIKGLLAQFAAWLESQGFKGSTYYGNIKTLVAHGANILDPEDVKRVIARLKKKNGEPWCDTAKMMMRYSYDSFAKMLGITWTPPKYKQRDFEAFIPEEPELDALIASCRSKRMATYLQCLKETFGDPTKVLRLRWIDITNNIVTIAQPVKNHLPRQLEVSQKLLSMLNNLPKSEERIFPTTYATMANMFQSLRKRAAHNLQNPRLLKISLTGFRHWGGTMLAYYTNGNVLIVKKLLGHRRVENTMKYIGRIQFKDDGFDIATATTDDEIKQLGAAGFEKYDEHNGVHFYRKPKKFKA